MTSKKDIADALSTYLGEYDAKNGGEFLFYSPFKNHRKKKLQVNLDPSKEEFGYWNDWITDNSGRSVFSLLKRADCPKSAFNEMNRVLDSEFVRSSYTSTADDESDESVELPEKYTPLYRNDGEPWFKNALTYIIQERGLTLADIIKYRIGHCPRGRYSGRIIVPSYSAEGELNYFVARDHTGSANIKYLNPAAPKNTIVFGSRIAWNYPVTLVEGVFDAIAARRNAIPLLGKRPSEILRRKLYFEQPPKVYIALDEDALADATQLAKELMDEGLEVRVLEMEEGKDPADTGFRTFQNRLQKTRPLDFRSLVSLKLNT
jgi:hypothetical protein